MEKQHKTSPVEAFRVATASIIFAITAQIILGLGLIIIVVAYRQGAPRNYDWWLVLTASCLPYMVLGLQTMYRAVGGVDSVFPAPQPLPISTTKQDLRMIPVYRQQIPRYNGVDVEDLQHFIKRICKTGDWRQRSWIGTTGPSGLEVDREYHAKMMAILKQAGFIVGHKPRYTGRLLVTDPDRIVRHLQIGSQTRTL